MGLLEGVKDRRCVIAAILEGGRRVVVAPITGTEPDHAHKIPLAAGAFGLARRSWIVTSELNITVWPGHDLRPAREPSRTVWRPKRERGTSSTSRAPPDPNSTNLPAPAKWFAGSCSEAALA
ncbi:MAG TPA: hypothetical protein VII63_04305 [Caulobacteraceae bacterium]